MSRKLHLASYLKIFSRTDWSQSTVNARHNSTKQLPPIGSTPCQNSAIPESYSKVTEDLIGPPNQVSNLRAVKFHIPACESTAQKMFRLERQRVQDWNEEFWIKHNTAFIKEGEEFRKKKLGSSEKRSLNAEEMSEFYKAFLDKNWRRHVQYNFEWYSRNIYLLVLAMRVKLTNLLKF